MDEFGKGLKKTHGGDWALFDQRWRGFDIAVKGFIQFNPLLLFRYGLGHEVVVI